MVEAPSAERARPRGPDPRRLTRWVWRAGPVVLVAAALSFWLCFGALRVPAGMDGIPSIPPGSLCLIDKRTGSVRVGSAVFADLPEGGTVLARVAGLSPEGLMTLRNDDPAAQQPDSDDFGPLPPGSLRGVVLVVFAGRGAPGEVLRDR